MKLIDLFATDTAAGKLQNKHLISDQNVTFLKILILEYISDII